MGLWDPKIEADPPSICVPAHHRWSAKSWRHYRGRPWTKNTDPAPWDLGQYETLTNGQTVNGTVVVAGGIYEVEVSKGEAFQL